MQTMDERRAAEVVAIHPAEGEEVVEVVTRVGTPAPAAAAGGEAAGSEPGLRVVAIHPQEGDEEVEVSTRLRGGAEDGDFDADDSASLGAAGILAISGALATSGYDPQFRALELSPSSSHGGTPMSRGLDENMLTTIMPALASAPTDVRRFYLDLTNEVFSLFEIDTIESRALFLAHANIESAQYQFLVEADRRDPFRPREKSSADPTWAPDHVTPQQRSEYVKRGYASNRQISPRGQFRYVGRGPLQVTTYLGYKRGVEVLDVWGQELGRRGMVDAASTLLHAAGEIGLDPSRAAIPRNAFLLSGAHFKAARRVSTVTSMDKAASASVPTTPEEFLRASGSMYGIGSFRRLKAYSAANQRHVVANLNAKCRVFPEAIQALCAGRTGGACSMAALKAPFAVVTLPLP